MQHTVSSLPLWAIGTTAIIAIGGILGMSIPHETTNRMPWDQPAAIRADVGEQSAPNDVGLRTKRSRDGLFYINASVNGSPVRFVVDTGASMMVLSNADAAAAHVPTPAVPATIMTADGAATMYKGRVDRLDVAGVSLHAVPVAIVPGSQVSLIGGDVLSRMQSVTIRGDHLEIR